MTRKLKQLLGKEIILQGQDQGHGQGLALGQDPIQDQDPVPAPALDPGVMIGDQGETGMRTGEAEGVGVAEGRGTSGEGR